MRAISNFSKMRSVIYPKNRPKQTCDSWLITTNQQTLHIGTSIFELRETRNQRDGNYKTAGNYKITPLMVQCQFQSYD